MKRDGVCQGQGGHIADCIGQEDPEEQSGFGNFGDDVEAYCSEDMEDCEYSFCGEEAVSNHTDEERRYYGRPSGGAVCPSYF